MGYHHYRRRSGRSAVSYVRHFSAHGVPLGVGQRRLAAMFKRIEASLCIELDLDVLCLFVSSPPMVRKAGTYASIVCVLQQLAEDCHQLPSQDQTRITYWYVRPSSAQGSLRCQLTGSRGKLTVNEGALVDLDGLIFARAPERLSARWRHCRWCDDGCEFGGNRKGWGKWSSCSLSE